MMARTSPRRAPRPPIKPLIALAYHLRYTTDPESVKALPNGEAWLASVERADEKIRHLSVHRGHSLDISNGHDALVDISAAKQMTSQALARSCANVSPSSRRAAPPASSSGPAVTMWNGS
jgi:hypothetical protein